MTDARAAAASATPGRKLMEGEDFYREGPFLVFTAAFHLRRGYCCGSGCRHCPYPKPDARELPPDR